MSKEINHIYEFGNFRLETAGDYFAFSGDREGHGLDILLLSLKNPDDEKIIAAPVSRQLTGFFC